MQYRQARYDEPLLSEISSGNDYHHVESGAAIPESLRRKSLDIPSVAEYDVVRHYTRLSQMNYAVDIGMYPLGSCTMKLNPKFADRISSMPEFSTVHPLAPEESVQGNLRVMYELQEFLKKISDMDAVSLQPLAGAHGEYTGILIARKYHEVHGELERRREVIIPDSAHGTNPASAAMAGFDVVEIPSSPDGMVDMGALRAALSDRTALFMITNPNTLGIFEDRILEIADLVHSAGALLYYDGANFNAILGKTSPGLMGFDIVHFNLHKTFATPHGGGGPGSGPVGVRGELRDYLPVPVVEYDGKAYHLNYDLRHTIGAVSSYYGSFLMHLRAWAYILYHGGNGLTRNTERAVLNTNYLAKRLSGAYRIPYKPLKKHEVVVSSDSTGRRAQDIAKYILDNGMHPPTVYFPLIVHEALMIEPTETVSKADLDRYADIMLEAAREDPEGLKRMPLNTAVGRIDEVRAAREPKLRW